MYNRKQPNHVHDVKWSDMLHPLFRKRAVAKREIVLRTFVKASPVRMAKQEKVTKMTLSLFTGTCRSIMGFELAWVLSINPRLVSGIQESYFAPVTQ